jgi:recombinational DNA repair protein (RecF pathway)
MTAKNDPLLAEKVMLEAGLKPLEPYKTAHTNWKCKCLKCGKIVSPRYSTVKGGAGCAYCAGSKLDPEDAIAEMRKANLEPLEPFKSSKSKWKCSCTKCNKIVYPYHTAIKQGKGGCIYCAKGQYVDPEEAVQLMLKADLKPLEPYKGSGLRWKCLHIPCNQIVYPMYASIQQGQGGCLSCAGVAKKSDAEARKLMLQAKLEPLEEYIGANTRWMCKCLRCGNTVYPTYSDIKQGGTGCKYCAVGQYVDPVEAKKFMIENGFQPLEEYFQAHAKWESIHLICGSKVQPSYSDIQQGRGGCKYCAVSGFQYGKPSYLYIVTHQVFGAHKVGIGNKVKAKSNDRLYKHTQEGWEVVHVWDFQDGKMVAQMENRIFQILRNDLGIPQYLVKGQMRFGGQTETMDASLISIPALKKLVQKVIKEVQKESSGN